MTLTTLINTATEVVTGGIAFAMLLLLFVWSMVEIIMSAGDAKKREQARSRLLWSIVGIFVVFSLAGLIALLQNTIFGSDTSLLHQSDTKTFPADQNMLNFPPTP